MDELPVLELVADVLQVRPVRADRMTLTHSGNVIYSVDLPGRQVIVRMSDNRGTFDRTEQNLNALRELGLPVPNVIAADVSMTWYPVAYLILEKIPGRDLLYELPAMTPAQMTRLAEQIVAFKKTVATQLPQGAGFGWGHIGEGGAEPAWFFVFRSEQDATPPASDGTVLGDLGVRIHRQLVRFQPYFRNVRPTCFLEDLTTKNVLLHEGELQGIIDFDCVCFGDPLWMVGLAAGCIVNDLGTDGLFYIDELCRCWEVTPEQREVVTLYAAVRAVDFAAESFAVGDEERTQRLASAANRWLMKLERR